MNIQKADFEYEMKIDIGEASLLTYENKGKEVLKLDTEKRFRELNGDQTENEYFLSKTIKQEEIDTKSEEVEDQFSTDEFNEKQIQGGYFDSKSIKQEETDIKTENEEGDEFNTESSPFESENNFLWVDTKNHRADLDVPPMFKCLKCSYQTHKERYIKKHVLRHMPKTFECPLCPYTSNNKVYLSKHQLIHIPKEEANLHKCPHCLFTSKIMGGLTKHLLIHKKPHEITWYQCPECPHKTKFKHNLERHIGLHRKDPPMHKCTFCSYFSFKKADLKVHLNCMHKRKDPTSISCQEEGCSFKTRVKTYLLQHIRRFHKCQKILKCSKCPFETKYIITFKAHELKHENPDKWFSCPLCPFKARYLSVLTVHALVHKSDSEIKWFHCSDCSFRTKRKQSLTGHKLKHSSKEEKFTDWFYCYGCTWKSFNKKSLARHIWNKHRDAEGRICSSL